MVTVTREESLPIVKVVVPAGATQTISFPQTFFGIAEDLRISNLDAANTCSYQIDGATQPAITLAAGAFVAIGGTRVTLITIIAGAAGATQIEASVRKIG